MPLSQGQKIGLVAAAGVGAFLLAGGSKSAKAASKPATPAGTDCSQLVLLASAAAAGATKADLPTLKTMKATADTLGCTEASKTLATVIAALEVVGGGGGVVTTPPKPSTKTFSPAAAKNPARAHSLAQAFGTAKVPADWASAHPSDVGSDGTFKDWAAYGRFNNATPANQYAMTQFQDAAGLTADGIVGTQTINAMSYWWGNTSVGGSVGGEEKLCTSCGGEGVDSVAGCSSCMAKRGIAPVTSINNPESLGPYNTIPAQDEGYVKFDRAFGSSFGAGPAKTRAFGRNSKFGSF